MTDQPEPVEVTQAEAWARERWPSPYDCFYQEAAEEGYLAALRAQPSRDDMIEAQSVMHDQGFAAGLEEAAKVADAALDTDPAFTCCEETARDIATAIRARKEAALAPSP